MIFDRIQKVYRPINTLLRGFPCDLSGLSIITYLPMFKSFHQISMEFTIEDARFDEISTKSRNHGFVL